MVTKERPYVYFGAQFGDVASARAVGPHLSVLRRLLREYCNYRYAPELDAFYLPFRVDGDISHWDIEGVERLRLMRQRRYITIDIMVPRSKWQGASALEIRRYLAENFKSGLLLIVNKLKKEHLEVDETRLFKNFKKLEKKYLTVSIFPEIIRIKILNGEIGVALPNMAVFIKLFSYRKNGYSLMPSFSDENGEIEITKDWLTGQIEASRNFAPTDYASRLEFCQPKLKLWLLGKEEIAKLVIRMNLFKKSLGIKQEDIERLAQVENPKYQPVSKLIKLQGENVIAVELVTKKLS